MWSPVLFNSVKMDAKHHILNAAATLFAQKGYAAASIREIAAMASVNIAMVNYYFRSKEQLFRQILHLGVQSVMEKTELLMEQDLSALEKIDAIIDLYTQHLFVNREVSLIFFQEQIKSNIPAVSELVQSLISCNRKIFEQIIKDGQKGGLFSTSIDAAFLYDTLLGTCQQVVVHASKTSTTNKEDSLVAYLKTITRKILLM